VIWARIIADTRRYAELQSGRFHRLVGPGIVLRLRLPGTAFHGLAEGDRGHLIGMELAQFGPIAVPVTVLGDSGGGPVAISGFRDNHVLVCAAETRQ
jgi:hypothetical protein